MEIYFNTAKDPTKDRLQVEKGLDCRVSKTHPAAIKDIPLCIQTWEDIPFIRIDQGERAGL